MRQRDAGVALKRHIQKRNGEIAREAMASEPSVRRLGRQKASEINWRRIEEDAKQGEAGANLFLWIAILIVISILVGLVVAFRETIEHP